MQVETCDLIRLENIQCYTHIGVVDQERAIGQKLLFCADIYLDTRAAGISDDLADTISYVELSKQIIATATKREYKLLENLGHIICLDLMRYCPRITAVRATIHKPHIPAPEFVGKATVSVYRHRQLDLRS